jgi:putative ABC transport system ATP-binding protein
MLELKNVWRTYGEGENEVVALRDVNLRIDDGEFVAIVGPSGSGKSTMLQIIGLLDRPTSGETLLDGQPLDDLSDSARTRLRLLTLGFVFQRFHLLPGVSAIENVILPMEAAGVPVDERYARAAALLDSVGLGHRLDFPPAKLSGGQRQRVAIARALGNHPRLILADEPTGELHSDDTANIIALFRAIQREGRTVVVVTHDPEVAKTAERTIEIRDGRVHDLGTVRREREAGDVRV